MIEAVKNVVKLEIATPGKYKWTYFGAFRGL
jgi:hypothetical protein